MTEKNYKATGRKEHLQFNGSSQHNQNIFYDDYGNRTQGIKTLENYKQKIGDGNVDGLLWTWITQIDNATITTTSEKVISSYLRFKWNKLEGVLGFTGKIAFILKSDGQVVVNKHVDALIEYSGQWIGVRNLKEYKEVFPVLENQNQMRQNWNQNQQRGCSIEFAFSLTPIFDLPPSINIISNFEKSHITDTILQFLSIHSEFFDKMFNSDFKEKNQTSVTIKDVDSFDFSNFLSLIYPNQAEITVDKVGKYLELADKYFMAAVTHKCEEFLLQNKRVKPIQKIVFADQHNLNKLLRETLASVDSREELDGLTLLPEFASLSDTTKASFLHKIMHFAN